MTMLQLNPPLPMVTPLGRALAHVLIDYGPEHDLCWVCFQTDSFEVWTWPNYEVRSQENITLGRSHEQHNQRSITKATAIVDFLAGKEPQTLQTIAEGVGMAKSAVDHILKSHAELFERTAQTITGKRGMTPFYYRVRTDEPANNGQPV